MNAKGFTLIELVAIIIILAAIFLVSFPNFINIAKVDEEKKYDDMVENLCTAGKSYIYENMDDFEELSTINSKIKLKIEELIVYGNVDENFKNLVTQKDVKKDILTYTVLSDYSLDCEYEES